MRERVISSCNQKFIRMHIMVCVTIGYLELATLHQLFLKQSIVTGNYHSSGKS